MNVWQAYEELKEALGPEASRKVAMVLDALAQEHVRSEVREVIDPLQVALRQLAEAQVRTEQAIQRLGERIEALAEAQRRTDERLEALAHRVEQLAEAQRRTEEALQALSRRLDDTNRQVGGLAMTIGYTLENAAYQALPPLLEKDHGLRLRERLRRDFVLDTRGIPLEVNILGRGERQGQQVWVVGESKAQLSRQDVDRFVERRLGRLGELLGGPVFGVLVAHMESEPGVRDYARSKGVAVYLSYEFDA
ncbi:MAG: hypothetical protein N2438_11685 [Limisphaera sp.]|nr:hypothetical protein [Limisphaera sp.]